MIFWKELSKARYKVRHRQTHRLKWLILIHAQEFCPVSCHKGCGNPKASSRKRELDEAEEYLDKKIKIYQRNSKFQIAVIQSAVADPDAGAHPAYAPHPMWTNVLNFHTCSLGEIRIRPLHCNMVMELYSFKLNLLSFFHFAAYLFKTLILIKYSY